MAAPISCGTIRVFLLGAVTGGLLGSMFSLMPPLLQVRNARSAWRPRATGVGFMQKLAEVKTKNAWLPQSPVGAGPEDTRLPQRLAGVKSVRSKTQMSHLLVDAYGLPFDFLNSTSEVRELLDSIAETMGFTVAGKMAHHFDPQGLTMLYLLTESHASIHSWPEEGYAAFDFLTCGNADLLRAANLLRDALQEIAPDVDFRFSHFRRGVHDPAPVNDVAVLTSELQTGKMLVSKTRSSYQEIEVWDVEGTSFVYGERMRRSRILYLDGVMQLATSDEAMYHESLVHPAMLAHPEPRRVCILGGGDGGALREVLQHRSVESAALVEIDAEVPRVAEEWLPSLSHSFRDPRAKLLVEDAFAWIHTYSAAKTGNLDVIIVDLLDVTIDSPLIEFLYADDRLDRFINDTKAALGRDGVLVVQLGDQPDDVCSAKHPRPGRDCKALRRQYELWLSVKRVFAHSHMYSVWIPSFLGMWTFVVATDSPTVELRWSRNETSVDRDIAERLLQHEKLAYFTGLAMQGIRVQPPIWKEARDILEPKESPRPMVAPSCGHLTRLAPNSDLPGLQIPYMLARSTVTTGLGAFTLRPIKQGEVIWRFYTESFLPVTEHTWRAVLERQIRLRNWTAAPELDAAVLKGGEAALEAYLRKDWIIPLKLPGSDSERPAMMLELDDGKFVNHGYTAHRSRPFMEAARAAGRSEYGRGLSTIALRDVEACSELLEDYWRTLDEVQDDDGDEDEDDDPQWWTDVLRRHSLLEPIEDPPYKDTATGTANLD